MKVRSVGAFEAASIAAAASMLVASQASSQVLGLMATTRQVGTTGSYLVNVFVVTGSSSNAISSVSGGQSGSISTNAAGGFLQGAGTQSLWAPAGFQNWTTLDSFLTVGGSFNTTTNAWLGTSITYGDPTWNIDYFNTAFNEQSTANAFHEQSNTDGFTNPFGSGVTSLPTLASNGIGGAGWFAAGGTTSPARSLASLTSLPRQYASVAGRDAASGSSGMLIAQFYVSGSQANGEGSSIFFNQMRIFLGSADNQLIGSFAISVPAPAAAAALLMSGLAGGRRRR
jgi:hypothetical protein